MDNYFTTAQSDQTRDEIEMLIDAANIAQFAAMRGPAHGREAASRRCAEYMEMLKRLGQEDAGDANDMSAADMLFIVQAANAHDDLVAAIESAVQFLDIWPPAEWGWREQQMHEVLSAALAKVRH